MAKCHKDKQHSLSASSRLSSSAPSSSSHRLMASSITAPPQSSTARPERDLIVFPETKKPAESDKFRDIDVDKLTNEELEKLLLDDNFGTSSKATRPSSLLGFNLSASYPGGHACSPSPFPTGSWTPGVSTPSGSGVSTPTNQQAPLFPTAPFPKPVSFRNGFPPGMSPYMGLTAPQSSFLAFTPIQTAAPIVYQQPHVDPVLARLLDKIASTSEYLKNGRLASMDVDSAPGPALSLAPDPPAQPAAAEEPTTVSRFEWLDLDPLTRRREEADETPRGAGGRLAAAGEPAGDPWDAVLETEGSRGNSSPTTEAKAPPSKQVQPRRASVGAAMTRSPSLSQPPTSSQQLPNSQVGFQVDLSTLIECMY